MFLFKVYKADRQRRGARTTTVTSYIVMAPTIEAACQIAAHERGGAGDRFGANIIAGAIASAGPVSLETRPIADNILALCEYRHPETG